MGTGQGPAGMGIEALTKFFMWCTIINAGLLIVAFLAWLPAGDLIYRLHGRWFPMPRETFNAVFYGFIGFYKVLVYVFCLVPWLALEIIGR